MENTLGKIDLLAILVNLVVAVGAITALGL